MLPLVARHGAAVVAISNDETGISKTQTSVSKWPGRS